MKKLSKRAAALAGAAIVVGLVIALNASPGHTQPAGEIPNAEKAVASADAGRIAACGPGTAPAQAQALPQLVQRTRHLRL